MNRAGGGTKKSTAWTRMRIGMDSEKKFQKKGMIYYKAKNRRQSVSKLLSRESSQH